MKQQMWKSVKVFCEIYSRCTFSNPCPAWLASILSSVLCCVQQVFKPGHTVMRNCVPWVGELPKRAACEASGSSINMTLIWSFIRFPPPSLPQLSSFPSLQGRPVPQAQQSVWMNVTSLWHSGGIDQLWSCKDLHDFDFAQASEDDHHIANKCKTFRSSRHNIWYMEVTGVFLGFLGVTYFSLIVTCLYFLCVW